MTWFRFHCLPKQVWLAMMQVPSGTPIVEALRGTPVEKMPPKHRYAFKRSRRRYLQTEDGKETEKMFASGVLSGQLGIRRGVTFYE